MELWPDGPWKESSLRSARSALHSLVRTLPKGSFFDMCDLCGQAAERDRDLHAGCWPRVAHRRRLKTISG